MSLKMMRHALNIAVDAAVAHAETDTSFFTGLCIFKVVSPATSKEFAIALHVHAPDKNINVFIAQGSAANEYATHTLIPLEAIFPGTGRALLECDAIM